MDLSTRESLLYRIFSGTNIIRLDGIDYLIKYPDKSIRYMAQKIYQDAVYKNRYDNWYTSKSVLNLLDSQGIFSPSDDEKLKKLDKDLEELKVQLFQSLLHPEKTRFVRKSLTKVRLLMEILSSAKHCLDYLTLEGYASLEKSQYIAANTVFYMDGSQVFIGDYKVGENSHLIRDMIIQVGSQYISTSVTRELARTEPWRSYWGSNKNDVFGKPAIELSDEQRALVLFTKMYDGAYEHSECPDEEIMEDNDLFDGWMIFQRRKREKEKTAKQVDSVIGAKQREAEELFIPTGNQSQAQKIHGMNTFEAKVKRSQRDKVIQKIGTVKDSQFPDRRQQIITQANREFAEKVR